jgi:hypothetical protein
LRYRDFFGLWLNRRHVAKLTSGGNKALEDIVKVVEGLTNAG